MKKSRQSVMDRNLPYRFLRGQPLKTWYSAMLWIALYYNVPHGIVPYFWLTFLSVLQGRHVCSVSVVPSVAVWYSPYTEFQIVSNSFTFLRFGLQPVVNCACCLVFWCCFKVRALIRILSYHTHTVNTAVCCGPLKAAHRNFWYTVKPHDSEPGF